MMSIELKYLHKAMHQQKKRANERLMESVGGWSPSVDWQVCIRERNSDVICCPSIDEQTFGRHSCEWLQTSPRTTSTHACYSCFTNVNTFEHTCNVECRITSRGDIPRLPPKELEDVNELEHGRGQVSEWQHTTVAIGRCSRA